MPSRLHVWDDLRAEIEMLEEEYNKRYKSDGALFKEAKAEELVDTLRDSVERLLMLAEAGHDWPGIAVSAVNTAIDALCLAWHARRTSEVMKT